MTHAHRVVLKWARILHIYLTLFGLVLLLFFAVSGFMMNHEDWFRLDEPIVDTRTGSMPSKYLEPLDKLAIVEYLRKEFGAVGAMDSFDDNNLQVVFKSPSRLIEVDIERDTGDVTARHEYHGVYGILKDLHRGKDGTGEAWSLIIDGVCVMVVMVSVTGLILWSSLRNRARHGLAVIILGAVLSVGVYLFLVP